MTELVRPYRGISAGDRIIERRERLIEAALDVVGRSGVAAATIGSVCEQAGLTKRYFYESFRDLDTLLEATLERLHQSLLEDIRATMAELPADPFVRARATVTRLVEAMDDARMARLYVEASGHPALQIRRQEAYTVYADLVVTEILGQPAPDAQARVQALVFVTGVTQVVVSWLQGSLALSRSELVDALARALIA